MKKGPRVKDSMVLYKKAKHTQNHLQNNRKACLTIISLSLIISLAVLIYLLTFVIDYKHLTAPIITILVAVNPSLSSRPHQSCALHSLPINSLVK